MRAENVTGPVASHAEGPVWWQGWGGLRWVDGHAGDLLTLREDGIHRMHLDDGYAAFVRPRSNGGFVAFGRRTLYLAEEPHGPVRAAQEFDLGDARFNDGTVDPQGRLLAGSMAGAGAGPVGRLLRIDREGTVQTVVDGVTISNGVAFSPDGTIAYYVDTVTGRVDRFDARDGELVERRPFIEIPSDQGFPDGLTVAADGSVWVALWNGHAVHGYDADGIMRESIELPVPQVTACTFGDDDLSTLYITTSAQDLGDDHGTAAGSVFAVRPGVTGLPVTPYAG
ncbi:SMP-30/gluconolactonase/LRE family protein [Microbacterium sp. NPDC055903]